MDVPTVGGIFRPVRTYSDAFAYVRVRSEAFGCVRKNSICWHYVYEFVNYFRFPKIFAASGMCFDLLEPDLIHLNAIRCNCLETEDLHQILQHTRS